MFEAETTEGYKICLPGDLVINTLWAWDGRHGRVARKTASSARPTTCTSPGRDSTPSYVGMLWCACLSFAQEVHSILEGIVWSSRLRLYPEGFFEVVAAGASAQTNSATIVAHIAKETAKLDELRAATERTIALLKERRAALIAAAVTGQIDVEAAA